LPIDDDEVAIRQILWQATNRQYFQAIQRLTQLKGNLAVAVAQEDKSPDFTEEQAVEYYEAPLKTVIDKKTEERLINKVRLYSKVFGNSKNITTASVRISINFQRDYIVSSSGTKIAENHPRINLYINGQTLSDDGMDLPLYKSYFVRDLKDLPKDNKVLEDANELVNKLEEIRNAPLVDPYSGPALLSGSATGVFFTRYLGTGLKPQE